MLFTFSLHDFEYSHEWVFTEIFSLFRIENVRENSVRHECFKKWTRKCNTNCQQAGPSGTKFTYVSFQSLLFQVYMQWFKTWICKKESYIDLSILLDKINIFTVYILLYQSLVPVGIQVLKHSVILFFFKKSKGTNWSWIRPYIYIYSQIYYIIIINDVTFVLKYI